MRNLEDGRALPMSQDLNHVPVGFPCLPPENNSVHQKFCHWSKRWFQKSKSILLVLFPLYWLLRTGDQEMFFLPKPTYGSQYVWEHVFIEWPGDTRSVRWLMGWDGARCCMNVLVLLGEVPKHFQFYIVHIFWNVWVQSCSKSRPHIAFTKLCTLLKMQKDDSRDFQKCLGM